MSNLLLLNQIYIQKMKIMTVRHSGSKLRRKSKPHRNPRKQKKQNEVSMFSKKYMFHFYKYFAQMTSAHGFSWTVNERLNSFQRTISSILLIGCVICLSLTIGKTTEQYLCRESSYQSRFELLSRGKDQPLKMPDFMLCHSSPWSVQKSKALNISRDLLSYITIVLNPYQAVVDVLPKKLALYKSLETQYNKILKESFNNNLRSFLDAITIECKDFLRICMMGAFSSWSSCCDNVFNQRGVYSLDGKCFTTKGMLDYEFSIASSFDAIKVVMFMDENNPYNYINGRVSTWSSHSLKGISFSVIDKNDDPITSMYTSDFFNNGVMTRTKIYKKIIHKGDINCVKQSNYSQRNCKINAMNKVIEDKLGCIPFGLQLTNGENTTKICSPLESLHILNSSKHLREFVRNDFNLLHEEVCKSECVRTFFETDISSQTLENLYFTKDVKNSSSLKISLHTLYFPKDHIERMSQIPKGLMDWLGDVGGNCGFYLGASLFSIIEFLYFLMKMIFLILGYLLH